MARTWTIRMLKYPYADPDYRHVASYSDYSTMLTFILSLPGVTYDDCPIIMDDTEISIPVSYEQFLNYEFNYCAYNDGENPYYKLAFVSNPRYLGVNQTAFTITTDVWNTYQHFATLRPCIVERMHRDRWNAYGEPIFWPVSDYSSTAEIIVDNGRTLVGDRIWVGVFFKPLAETGSYDNLTNQYGNCIPSTWFPVNPNNPTQQHTVNGVLCSSLLNVYGNIISNPDVISIVMSAYPPFNPASTALEVLEIGTSPYKITGVRMTGLDIPLTNKYPLNLTVPRNYSTVTIANIQPNTTRNYQNEPKLKTFPYHYLKLTSNSNEIMIKNEEIAGNNPYFSITVLVSATVEGTKTLIRTSEGTIWTDTGAIHHRMNTEISSEFPMATAAWLSYMSQNKASINNGIFSKIGMGVLGLAAGAGVAMATGGTALPYVLAAGVPTGVNLAGQVVDESIKREDLKSRPDEVRSSSSSALAEWTKDTFAGAVKTLFFGLRPDESRRVSDYYFMFGYKYNQLVLSHDYKTRYRFNHYKTKGLIVDNIINFDHKRKFEEIFDNGVTIWHKRGTTTLEWQNYYLENTEMSLYTG